MACHIWVIVNLHQDLIAMNLMLHYVLSSNYNYQALSNFVVPETGSGINHLGRSRKARIAFAGVVYKANLFLL